ncbi:MAG: hypothetical protein N3I35_09270 [Clostridia bacterium]|nr:hypothetical protein [Clostridia bacterium]
MSKGKLLENLLFKDISISLKHVLDNSKADSGGERDINFLNYLVENKLVIMSEAVLKRSATDIVEEYYLERYKKMNYESDRHFLCRTVIQDELQKLGIKTLSDIEAGNFDILRSSSNYDIVLEDFSAIIDVGLTPARNYFRGLTDLKVKHYLLTSYFDDYMDDIIFSVFSRSNDNDFLEAVRDYQEGFKLYTPQQQQRGDERMYYNHPEIQ